MQGRFRRIEMAVWASMQGRFRRIEMAVWASMQDRSRRIEMEVWEIPCICAHRAVRSVFHHRRCSITGLRLRLGADAVQWAQLAQLAMRST